MADKKQTEDKEDKKERDRAGALLTLGRAFALASTISFQIAVPVVMGVFGGRYLDEKLGTQPWFLLAGIFLGLAAGVTGVVRIVQSFFKSN